MINSKDFRHRYANNDRPGQFIDLPREVLLLYNDIVVFREATSRTKRTSAWHLRCVSRASYECFRQQQIFSAGQFEVAFSLMAANAYLALFTLRRNELPHCTPVRVIAIKQLAGELLQATPTTQLLPGQASMAAFMKALSDL